LHAIVFEDHSLPSSTYRLKTEFSKWPFKAIQGHIFQDQWKVDEGLHIDINVGLVSKGFEDIASESTKNRRFRVPYCRLTPLSLQGTPTNVYINLILPDTRVPNLHFFAGDSVGLYSFKFS